VKKTGIFLFLFILSFVTSLAYAHPPSDIKIAFDPKTKMLTAVIMHNTSNPSSHYIRKVDIGLNGNEIIEYSLGRQENNESQTISYRIPEAKEGDTLSVEGYCSISGKLEKEIKVGPGE